MTIQVLIAHAKNEEDFAEKLAIPLRTAGYHVTHEGTLLVGESVIAEATKLLREGAPLVICGTTKAMGSRWTRKLAEAARAIPGTRIFAVQMDEDADIEAISLDESVAGYWKSPVQAEKKLVTSLQKQYPLTNSALTALRDHDLEARYRDIALKACDIIDLANLPEDDRHLASRELELRRLYVALRMQLEIKADDEVKDDTLKVLEHKRRNDSWQDDGFEDSELVSLGERLSANKRIIILGDPGAGKSTLLRWLSTAYLLKLQTNSDWRDLPDIASLPNAQWLPILIRCRDLPSVEITLDAILLQSLRKSELPADQCEPLRRLLRNKLEHGDAMLLVDGLDEITDPGARMRFAEQLTNIHRAVPLSPIIVTSRIVGYREMGFRLSHGFEHLTVADLNKSDKDEFAHRWCALTERFNSREAAASLIHDIHSNDRIERLTGNPMLLTTMALIKRKIGRLPQRRVDLYEKAVEVLLNWRSVVDAALNPREALPQLEYLAHAMCADGIQQIREDQILELLRQARIDFPHIHPLQDHSPEDFLSLLERRTGLLMQSGYVRYKGRSVPVYEFRHLTLQEYLAGIALVQGHYRNRNKNYSQAQVVQPLAGQVGKVRGEGSTYHSSVVENWREPLRLCIAASNDNDVNESLLAILRQMPNEVKGIKRARTILAVLCLADEPNVTDEVVHEVLSDFIALINAVYKEAGAERVYHEAAESLAASRWGGQFSSYLLNSFFEQDDERKYPVGGLYATVQELNAPTEKIERENWFASKVIVLENCDERAATGIALHVVEAAYFNSVKFRKVSALASSLIRHLSENFATNHAISWALGWMLDHWKWKPNQSQLNALLCVLSKGACDSASVFWMAKIFERSKVPQSIDILMCLFPSMGIRTKCSILNALGFQGGQVSLDFIKKQLRNDDLLVRRAALKGISSFCELDTDKVLLSGTRFDAFDPCGSLTGSQISNYGELAKMTPRNAWQRYSELIQYFELPLKIPKNPPRSKREG